MLDKELNYMTVIGIDLGTTNSAIAYLKNERPEIIVNKDGQRTTPSIFHMKPETNEIVIGATAKNAMAGAPKLTASEVKRLMGTGENVTVGNKAYTPEEISAHYLKYLKEAAEHQLGTIVTEAVITVPAYFSDAQRKATKSAGEIAGLKVERIINEPTAAAISFCSENMTSNMKLAIYDLGGGTFDVSIVELFDGVVEVKATSGNNSLGGLDFDKLLADWLIKVIERKENVRIDSGSEIEILQRQNRLKLAAEEVKKVLSAQSTAQFEIPFFMMKDGMPISISETITRDEFEDLIRPLAESTLLQVEEALQEANLSVHDIDDVLLVGGSTRIPLVQQIVQQKFNKAPRKDINPDEAVALGAAIQAGIKTGIISSDKGIMVLDVCPYSLGIETSSVIGSQIVKGFFSEIIEANSPIPIRKSKRFNTLHDNQTVVDINVFQGKPNEEMVQSNLAISSEPITLEGIPPRPANQEMIDVIFSYDINGILEVEAEIVSTGKRIKKQIDTQTGVMTKTEIQLAKQRADTDWTKSQLYDTVKNVVSRAERILPDLQGSDITKVESLLQQIKLAVQDNDETFVRKLEDELTDLLIELV